MNLNISHKNTCCFIGHREIKESTNLHQKIYCAVENLILTQRIDTFLFGSKSRFNMVCYEQVTKLKEKYPHIKRIYIRAEYPEIDSQYKAYLLQRYEETYFPKQALRAGSAVYVARNYAMIDKSDVCVFYYNAELSPTTRKSGTKIALEYAQKRKKNILLFP